MVLLIAITLFCFLCVLNCYCNPQVIIGLGDIEIMYCDYCSKRHCDYCSKRHCDYCYIAFNQEHFAEVNKAENHTTQVTTNINTLSVDKNILVSVSFLTLCTQSFSIFDCNIFRDILHMRFY